MSAKQVSLRDALSKRLVGATVASAGDLIAVALAVGADPVRALSDSAIILPIVPSDAPPTQQSSHEIKRGTGVD